MLKTIKYEIWNYFLLNRVPRINLRENEFDYSENKLSGDYITEKF